MCLYLRRITELNHSETTEGFFLSSLTTICKQLDGSCYNLGKGICNRSVELLLKLNSPICSDPLEHHFLSQMTVSKL